MKPRRKGERKSYLKKRTWEVSEITAVLTGRGFIVSAVADGRGCTIIAVKGDKRHPIRVEYGKLVLFTGEEDVHHD